MPTWRRLKKYGKHDKHNSSTPKEEPIPTGSSKQPTNLSTWLGTSVPARECHSNTDSGPEILDKPQTFDRRSDPLGLSVLYEPTTPHTIDVIFVHGLGGSSQQTWSKNKESKLFWPKEWLPLEPQISTARVSSFGYNAHFANGGSNIFNISDFAKELLFEMKFGTNKHSRPLEVGRVPIIFVAHSMGGLVVKKAYILGQNDEHYKDIVKSTCSIIFLATPHRGSNYAEVLNRILKVSIFNHSRQYISELRIQSPTLQEINDQFRNLAPAVQIVSFFETMPTGVGPKKFMVVEKDSSTLGYPGEIQKPLNGDHHDVCKYINLQDSNYKSVRDVLSSMVRKFKNEGVRNVGTEDILKVGVLLGMPGSPEDDLQYFLDRRMEGSCEWILANESFKSWIESVSSTPQMLWLRGLPGTGKSVISAYVVRHLQDNEADCQFYFFRYGHQTRTSLNALLRSLAYQIACQIPEYGRMIAKLSDDGFNLEKAESRVLWQKLFVQALFKIGFSKSLYWVIDGLDESDSPQTLLNLLGYVSSSSLPLRILFVSRKNQALSIAFERLAASITTQYLSPDDSAKDLQLYVEKEIEFMRAAAELKQHVTSTIMNMANGNFLWVHLVLKEVMLCHTEVDIEQALKELPAELGPLYQRMEATLAKQLRVSDQNLAKTILTWATCARRPLTLPELSQALPPEYQHVLDLQYIINQVCGGFVTINPKGNVTMIHQTAQDYLTKTSGLRFSISPPEAHYQLFKKCLEFLSSPYLRTRVEQVLSQPFLLYAATYWAEHLDLSSAYQDQGSLSLLTRFLRGPSVLTWIHSLAFAGQLRIMVLASKSLLSFLDKRARLDAEESPIAHWPQEKETIGLWAIDLVKIVGKFGTHLARYPKSIYKLIPPFCPQDSIIHRQFGPKNQVSALRVSGFSKSSWDDNIATFSVERDTQGVRIKCLPGYFAILVTDGTVILYHSMTCEESRRFVHGERVLAMQFNNSGDKLVTYGFRTTKVWNVSSAHHLHCISNPTSAKALAVTFSENDTAILSCSEDRAIRQWSLIDSLKGWEEILGDDDFCNHHHNSPNCVSFNQEGTKIAIAYRGFPLSVWTVDSPGIVGICERPGNAGNDIWTGVDRVGWNPVTGHVIGIYSDGCVFKWHPEENDNRELKTVAWEIQCSPDGNIFVTSGSDGTLRIWDFHDFALIYQLSCTSPVTDIAIDPNSRRIYDLRDSFCNVWGPNALTSLAEADEKARETSSALGSLSSWAMLMASEVSAEMMDPITALAINPQTSAYCAGSDEGILTLSMINAKDAVELSRGFMPVSHIVWSDDRSTIATADLSGRVAVKALDATSNPPGEPIVFQTSSTRESVHQILLSPTSEYLLISMPHSTQIWSVGSKELVKTLVVPSSSIRWINHPHAADMLLCFGFTDVRGFKWDDFLDLGSLQINRELIDIEAPELASDLSFPKPSANGPSSHLEFETLVDKTFVTPDGSIMLLETSRTSAHRRRKKQFMIIKTNEIPFPAGVATPITGTPLPEDIQARIEIPLGFLDSDSIKTFWTFSSRFMKTSDTTNSPSTGAAVLAFLDKDFWVCTGLVSGSGAGITKGVKRHFFLPRDWLNMESLELAVMTKDGMFLCPRNGEVAVVRDGLKEEWIS